MSITLSGIERILFFSLAVLTLSANAQDNALNVLDQQLAKYQSLSGDFQQTLVDEQGLLIQESSGEFVLMRPGLFRWDTREPFPQLLVSDLKTIWLYDPDLEQVTVRPYQNVLDSTPSLLLSGDPQMIAEKYQVEFAGLSSDSSPHFVLTPKFEGSSFTQLQLIFQDGMLLTMILRDSLEQTTTFQFSKLIFNPPVSAGQFEFTPPDGVDVLVDD